MKEALALYIDEIATDFKAIKKAYAYKQRQSVKRKQVATSEDLSLLEFLPYHKFISKDAIFENDKTLGFVLRVSHFSGVNEQAKQAFKELIANSLPERVTIQIINYASPKIGHLLDDWQLQGKQTDIFHKISSARKEFFLKASQENIIKNKPDLVLRDYELYFCLSCLKPVVETARQEAVLKLKALQEKFIQGLNSIGSQAKILSERELLSFLQEILHPSNFPYKPRVSPYKKDLREALEYNQRILMQKDQIVLDNKYSYVCFEVTNLPEVWDLSLGIDYIGNFEKGLSLPCPFYISMGFTLASRDSSQRMADKHRIIKTQGADSKLPMFFPKMLEERNDWYYVSEQIGQGERMGKLVMYVVLLLNDSHDQEAAVQILQDHFGRLKFSLSRVYYDCLNVFRQTLPFGIGENWPILDQLKVSSKVLSGACTNLMPVFADSQNYNHPLMLLVGRRGQVFFFNNFKTADHLNGNFNMVVVGSSGRGKSVWLQEYSVSLLKNGGTVVIIDDGRSFKNTCEILEGDFVDFGGGNFCLNPFTLYVKPKNIEDIQEYKENFEEPFIDLVLSILCIITNVNKNNDSNPKIGLYRSVYTSSIVAVMEKKGTLGGFSDIRDELLNNPHIYREATKSLIDEIVVILDNYAGNGRYAKYFNGKATLDIKNNFTVFELSDLERNEVLQSSALLTVTFLVYAKIRDRNTQTALIIDEFWRMGKHPILRDPIGGFSRRGRKYNLSLIVASQSMSDFEARTSEAGAIALSQADWRIILSVDGKDDDILDKQLGMEPGKSGEIEIVRNLRGIKGSYSEFMIRHSNNSWAIGRLLLDPFSAKLYSTKAEDVASIKAMRKAGISIEDAITSLISKEDL